MSRRHSLAVVAGAATLLAAVPLSTVFASYTWLFLSAVAITLVVGTAVGARSLRWPPSAQVLAMGVVLLLFLTWRFPSGEEIAGLIPTVATVRHFGHLLADAAVTIRDASVPVPDIEGLLLLTIAGVGLVAILVDLLVVGLRCPALAGLPMLAIYAVPVAVMRDGLSVLPFGFAAAGYLWLLVTDRVDQVRRFGRRFTADGRDLDEWQPSPLAAAGRRLAAVGIVIAIALPLAVPGMGPGLIDRIRAAIGARTDGDGGLVAGGPGARVDMLARLTGQLTQRETFAMVRVATDDPTPHYLRLGVADEAADGRFVSRAPTGDQPLADGLAPPPPQRPGVTGRRHQARIEAVDLDTSLAPVYQRPTAIGGLDGPWFFDPSTDQVFARGASVNGRTYHLEYVRMSYTPAALRTAGPIDPADVSLRRLSTVAPVRQVTDLVGRLTAGTTNQYDRVRAIHDHFSRANGFSYSMTAEPGETGHAIVDFLAGQKGFCVQYAMAMAWLVRAAGYPARVAVGFTRGAGPDDGVTTLTNRNLHAWAEVYFPGFGWVPFDPTPAGSVVGSVAGEWEPEPGTGPGGRDGQTPPPPTARGGQPNNPVTPAPPPAPEPGFGGLDPRWLAGIGVAGLLAVALLAPAARRRALRRSRLAGAVPGPGADVARARAHAAWAELLDTLADFGVAVDETRTPRVIRAGLVRRPDLDRVTDDLARLTVAEERARYAVTPVRPDGLGLAVLAIRQAIVDQATRRQRLRAWLLPRSVTTRWRLAVAGRVSRAIVATGQLRDAT
jgi:transglutaminase-like putative cysteine protease